jgi:uncharacterized membrane protein YidH (DUF202 family)
MNNQHEGQKMSKSSSYTRDHLANERTFLAWVRTSIGIMAFGFVVEKFALFIKQIALLLGNSSQILPGTSHSLQGYSSIFGIFLVALGVIICLLAFLKYKNVEKQIEDDTYRPSMLLNTLLTLSVLSIGVFLVVYLSGSI